MLSPVEELLKDPGASLAVERTDLARRNSLPVLRLVNNRLDLSLIEAGRLTAEYASMDLTALAAS